MRIRLSGGLHNTFIGGFVSEYKFDVKSFEFHLCGDCNLKHSNKV